MTETLLISVAAISMVSLLLIGLLLVRFETSYGEESRRRFAAELDAARKEFDRELSRLREEFSAQIETQTNLNQMSVKNIQTDTTLARPRALPSVALRLWHLG